MKKGLATLVVLAATALAAPAAQASSGYDRVQSYVDRANAALEHAIQLAESDPAQAGAELRRNLLSSRAAQRAARRVRSLRSRRSANEALRSRAAVAGLFEDNIEGYLRLLELSEGDLQELVAQAIGWSVEGRAAALEALTGLVDRLPERAQARVAAIIERLTQGSQEILEDLRAAVTSGDYREAVQGALTGAFALVGGTLEDVADGLEELLPEDLPAPAAEAIRGALDLANGIVRQVQELVTGIVGQIPAADGDYAPALPSLPSIGDLLGLVNQFLPFRR